MSDSYRRYYEVKCKLNQLLPEQWEKCDTRMINLSLLVSAIPDAKDLSLPALASEMPVAAEDSSLVQRERRWLMNKGVVERELYEPIIKPYLQAMNHSTIPIILDTTDVGVDCHMLTVGLGYNKRSLPITWECGEGSRGHTKGESQVALLDYTATLLPQKADVVILGDGEFGHTQLIDYCERQNWHYCLRIASDSYIHDQGQVCRLDSFDVQPGEVIWLQNVLLTQANPTGPVNILLTWDAKHQRVVALVTNFPLPQEALYWYEKRFWIEPLFGDLKGHGFDFQSSRLTHPERLSRLMLAVSLAYLWLCFLGSLVIVLGLAKLVDRPDRRDRSIFTIGRLWLKRRLKLDQSFPVSFFPFPFLSNLL